MIMEMKKKDTIAAPSSALAWGAAVFNKNIKIQMSEILKMTSSRIPSRPPGKHYTEFQLEEMEKELDKKNEMMEIQPTVMDAAIKDDAALVPIEVHNFSE